MKEEDRENIYSKKGLQFISDSHQKDANRLYRSMYVFIFVLYIPLIVWLIIFIPSIMFGNFNIVTLPIVILGAFSILCFIVMILFMPIFNVSRPGIGIVDSVIIKDNELIIKKGVMRDRWKKFRFPINTIYDIDLNVERYYDREKRRTPWFRRWISQRYTWKPDGAFNWFWMKFMRKRYCLVVKLNEPRTVKEPVLIPLPPSFRTKKVTLSEFIISIRPEDRDRFISIVNEMRSNGLSKKLHDRVNEQEVQHPRKKEKLGK